MNTIFKKGSIALLAAATMVAPLGVTTANADDGYIVNGERGGYLVPNRGGYHDGNRGGYRYGHRGGYRIQSRNNNDAIALGVIGLGVGAIIGSAIANSNNQPRVIYRQRSTPRYYPNAPRVISGGSYEPWSRSWYRYCNSKYRSFNGKTGTYRGYDGRDHFCVAR